MPDHNTGLIRLPARHTWLGLASLVGFGAAMMVLYVWGVNI